MTESEAARLRALSEAAMAAYERANKRQEEERRNKQKKRAA